MICEPLANPKKLSLAPLTATSLTGTKARHTYGLRRLWTRRLQKRLTTPQSTPPLSLSLRQSAVTLCARICFSLLPDLFESMLSFALFMRYIPAPRGHMLWEGGRIREGLCMPFPIPVSSSLCPLSTFFWVIVPSSLSSFDSRFCDPPSCGGGGRRRRSLSAPTHRLGASLFALCVSFVNSLEGQCRDISKTALPASSLPGGSA